MFLARVSERACMNSRLIPVYIQKRMAGAGQGQAKDSEFDHNSEEAVEFQHR